MTTRNLQSAGTASVITLVLLAVWTVAPNPVFADETASGIFPENATCYDATALCQQFVQYYMYNDEPDSLLETIDYWELNCGSAEPIRRARILAAIWDGAFTEDLYDTRLIDDLAWRFDPDRIKAQEDRSYADLGTGRVASVVDFFADAPGFDSFTVDIADQLLPYVVKGSPEEFFCLFYSGRSDQAFAMLENGALEGTELHRRYHWKLSELPIPEWRDFWGLTSSFWRPMTALDRVGSHTGLGLFAGRRWPHWVGRIELSLRLGRATEPYFVETSDFSGFSDRYGGLILLLDTGPTLLKTDRTRLDFLVGGSVEALNPFRDEEDIVLTTYHGHVGAGVHIDMGPQRAWFLELDGRREWISDPEEEGTYLGGDAWNVRISLGFFLKSGNEQQRAKLGS